MSLLVRSAIRVWMRRPAGPVLLALGILVATLLAGSSQLALESAEVAQEQEDALRLGDTMARIWTPGGYTVNQAALTELQRAVADERGVPPESGAPLFLEREALVTSRTGTEAGWRVIALPTESLQALGLPVPAPGEALVDPGGRQTSPDQASVRIQQAPDAVVELQESRLGQLTRTVLVGNQYVHDDQDRYEFHVDVAEGSQRLSLSLATADNGTDFDLEAVSPSGETRLDDAGTPAQPAQPRLEVQEPEAGNWTVRVHAKVANNVAFRLQIEHAFNARDAQALGRLLTGQGWRAVGADLGLTEQARFEVTTSRADLSVLGPGPEGLLVLPLERLQAQLDLDGEATGLLIMARPGERALTGLGQGAIGQLQAQVDQARASAQTRLDPLQGVRVDPVSNQAREAREDRLESTSRLLLVVLPAGIIAGILLATWAAGLHTRRLREELQVLAGLGQPRRTSYALAALHLGPPFLLGLVGALLAAPLLALVVARGLGLAATPVFTPGGPTFLVPLAALVPVAGTTWFTLRHAVEG
ncbi:MAG: PPC domain-containing protein, partial [Candidatus Thermoplasmatota archaeon]|nr:PPC domain-containing protein [Candidatus Thermoplasmatota archaeon]